MRSAASMNTHDTITSNQALYHCTKKVFLIKKYLPPSNCD